MSHGLFGVNGNIWNLQCGHISVDGFSQNAAVYHPSMAIWDNSLYKSETIAAYLIESSISV